MKEWMVVFRNGEYLIKQAVPDGHDIIGTRFPFHYSHNNISFSQVAGLYISRFAIISNLSNSVLLSFYKFDTDDCRGPFVSGYSFAFEGVWVESEMDVRQFIDFAAEKGIVFEDSSKFDNGYLLNLPSGRIPFIRPQVEIIGTIPELNS